MQTVLIIVATILVSAAIFIPVGVAIRKKIAESKIEGAEQEAKRLVELAKTEAENLEIVKIIRAMDMSIPELEAFKKRMKNELPGRVEIQKEETRSDDEFREDETEEI